MHYTHTLHKPRCRRSSKISLLLGKSVNHGTSLNTREEYIAPYRVYNACVKINGNALAQAEESVVEEAEERERERERAKWRCLVRRALTRVKKGWGENRCIATTQTNFVCEMSPCTQRARRERQRRESRASQCEPSMSFLSRRSSRDQAVANITNYSPVRGKGKGEHPTHIGKRGITENISFLVVPGLVKQCILGIDGLYNLRTIIDMFNRTVTIGNESNHATINYDLVKRFESKHEGIALVREHVMSPKRESSASMKIPEALCYVEDDRTLRASIELSQDEIRAKVAATELDQTTQNKLIALCNRYKQCFRKEPGRFRSFEYKIPMRDSEPFFVKSYPVPTKYRDKVSREIEKMLAYGVIERSNTSFINPLVVVAKKDGSVRVCLDARQVNERMIADHDGPEDVDQVLRQCDQIGIMSSIDLRSSFWQVPLNTESRKYTGFLHQGRTYQYTVVPFGLKISSAALHRAADTILGGLKAKVIDFVDDWLIVSPSVEQHLADLDELLGRIERENVTVNFDKIELYGAVKAIQSDHGSQFTSKAWKFATRRAGIRIFYSSIRHPQSNIVERYNKEVGRFLRSLASHDHRCWSRWCEMIAEIMNSTVNETTGFTPLELQTGQKPDRFWTKIIATQQTHVPHDEIINQARNNILKTGEKRANKLNNSHQITDLEIGEKVLMTRRQRRNAARKARTTEARKLGLAILPRHREAKAKMWSTIEKTLTAEQVKDVRTSPQFYLPIIYTLVHKIQKVQTEIQKLEERIEHQRMTSDEKWDDVIECDASSIGESD
ncbi:unnamed protein product [Trichogramma brassicae]|uniref:Integrase catalytic domain-containing protein n=1 Tax=Trichogramma brassicae TaxID=86971 RepID=A0A6H5IGA4_9HYME|nr:unnamed protein product [Trichogramma brassicae]